METVLLKAVTSVVYLGYKLENTIMAEKRSYLLWIVLNYGGSERSSQHMTFRIAISEQSATSDTSFTVSGSILPARRVKDRCKPHFLGSPFSRWFGRHLFSLPNRIIFLTPFWRLSSSLNIQAQEVISCSLCTWLFSLWMKARIYRNEGPGKGMGGGVWGEELTSRIMREICTWVFPFQMILQGKNNAPLIRHCPPCLEDSRGMLDGCAMSSYFLLKNIMQVCRVSSFKMELPHHRYCFAKGKELPCTAIPI